MRLIPIILLFIILGCSNHTKLVINHPTFMAHLKGRDDNINGAALTIRVRWDIKSK